MDDLERRIKDILTVAMKAAITAPTQESAELIRDAATIKIREAVFDGSEVLSEIQKLRAEVQSLRGEVQSLKGGLNRLDSRTIGSQVIGGALAPRGRRSPAAPPPSGGFGE